MVGVMFVSDGWIDGWFCENQPCSNHSILQPMIRMSVGLTRRENFRKNYRACPDKEGAKNISTEIYSAFLFLKKFVNFRDRARENFLNSTAKFHWPKTFSGSLVVQRCATLPS